MYQISKCVPQESLRDLNKAFDNFFAGRASFPRYKKKFMDDSFRLSGKIQVVNNSNSVKIKSNKMLQKPDSQSCGSNHHKNHVCFDCGLFSSPKVKLPKLGLIKLKELPKINKNAHILSVTISRRADRWFISIPVEYEPIEVKKNENYSQPSLDKEKNIVGIDLGIKDLAILSDTSNGNPIIFQNNRYLDSNLRKLRRLSKSYSRKTKRSTNQRKAKIELAKLHYRISNMRTDQLHQLTSYLIKNYDVIIIENLHIDGMIRNKKLSKQITDVAWGKFRKLLQYKCNWYDKELIIAPRFFPSSKLCSNCNNKKEKLGLNERTYRCDNCGLIIDRDYNAALNLKKFGEEFIKDNNSVADGWSETLNAYGADEKFSTRKIHHDEVGTEQQTISLSSLNDYFNN